MQHYLLLPSNLLEERAVTSPGEFEEVIQEYLTSLNPKKRDKALVDKVRYEMIRQVLKNPKDTSISTAQFRFWVKKMFYFSRESIYHDRKPVAVREDIYDILVSAHREVNHGGRDKTSAIVKCQYAWIPKELIARFVRCCPTCKIKRTGCVYNSIYTPVPSTPDYFEAFLDPYPLYDHLQEKSHMDMLSNCKSFGSEWLDANDILESLLRDWS